MAVVPFPSKGGAPPWQTFVNVIRPMMNEQGVHPDDQEVFFGRMRKFFDTLDYTYAFTGLMSQEATDQLMEFSALIRQRHYAALMHVFAREVHIMTMENAFRPPETPAPPSEFDGLF